MIMAARESIYDAQNDSRHDSAGSHRSPATGPVLVRLWLLAAFGVAHGCQATARQIPIMTTTAASLIVRSALAGHYKLDTCQGAVLLIVSAYFGARSVRQWLLQPMAAISSPMHKHCNS